MRQASRRSETLKRALAGRHREDREAYRQAKAEFVRATLDR
jgi:hypothetical protein